MTTLFDATPDYVRFNDGQLSTEYRYPRKIAAATSIQLASGPTWQASFTGSGSGSFWAWYLNGAAGPGTVAFTVSNSAGQPITGTGTAFTPDMVGKFIATDGAATVWKITGYTSATLLSGQRVSGNNSGSYSGVAYRIGALYVRTGGTVHPFSPAHGPFEAVDK